MLATIKRRVKRLIVPETMGNWVPFNGNLFDRFAGLSYMLERAQGLTVLDFGSCDGLISYEFARHGASLIHGFELAKPGVRFAQELFRDVPITAVFTRANLAKRPELFLSEHKAILCERYDVVLFLGMYHQLISQMSKEDLDDLVRFLLSRTERWFAVRTNMLPKFEHIFAENGFEVVSADDGVESRLVGKLCIYQRVSSLRCDHP